MKIKTANYFPHRVDRKTQIKYAPQALVLHITDGSLQSTLSWFQNGPVSAHWVVDKNGEWYEVVEEQDAAWHAGRVVSPTWKGHRPGINPNLYTIGIEAVNSGEFPPIKQWFSWAKGCKDICKRWGIPMDEMHIANHHEIRNDKTCPQPYFTRSWLLMLRHLV